MNPLFEQESRGLRPSLKVGLALVAIFLAVNLIIRTNREAPPPSMPVQVPPKRVIELIEGPPMRIDPDALARAGQERDDNALGMKFCLCPPGTFSMGGGPKSSRAGSPDPKLVRVTLSREFWMGKFEVTQAQWQHVTGRTQREQRAMDPRQPRPVGDGTTREHVGLGPDYPIYFTSHAEAEEFCVRLTEAERKAGRLEIGWVYRLPTEAQWEFACRAGTTTATAFGDRLGSTQANFDGTSPFNDAPAGPYRHTTMPVGRYPANAWGLHDMHGNLWEWCRDGYMETPPGGIDPFARPSSVHRVFRGGCWYEKGYACLSSSRLWVKLNARGSGLGFRVALVSTELWREARAGTHAPARQSDDARTER